MFSKGCAIAEVYTFPVLISHYFMDETVESSIASFVIINDEGWIITAAHVIDPIFLAQKHAVEIQKNDEAIAHIERNTSLDEREKKRRMHRFNPDQKWIKKYSYWWGADTHQISQWHILKENDIAVGQIENYDPDFIKTYPTFKEPVQLKHGTSLCKIGFPFYDIKATFDKEKSRFSFGPDVFPIPRFPLEGMFTRDIGAGKSADGQFDIKFLETSSPGLRGQSGGPIFDTEGRIWAIQSQTRHLPLGFSPKIKSGTREVEENQFLNVGWGAHIEIILKFLDLHSIKYNSG
ncbi:MAG: serine protease [Chitinophagaceae bacterium]